MTTVLVVDDDAAFRSLAGRMLRAWGYEVAGEAETVAAALGLAKTLRPDAMLVDVGLPDGDGRDLAALLSALPWRPRVVLISTDAEAADDALVRTLGVAGFLAKDELTDLAARGWLGG